MVDKTSEYFWSGEGVGSEISTANNSVGNTQTALNDTAKVITIPEGAIKIKIKHITAGEIVYIGNAANITPASTDVWPLKADEVLELDVTEDSEIYAVTDGTAVTLYAIGGTRV
jgi:hypothetical protein